ncbi:hypothetical protein PGO_122480 [Plasmodium gonderi]|uniref:Uncharacterized protein n=1 Tax=Plasmodium gonderi TaxID=77519 RepID=A0A1Y1JIB6_PLAGO|nr:hypothetical protein PGO_122480 [Plasmodium gonderi]GAW82251.1 hypothetical protein PGO_122480 [Plasmodium gonderi]
MENMTKLEISKQREEREDSNRESKTSYGDFIELRNKIIQKEKEILEKKKKKKKSYSENGQEAGKVEKDGQDEEELEEKGKVMYRTFDEFYKYKKDFEEHEVKAKNDAIKSLSKCNKERNVACDPDTSGYNNEKYSYIKFKTERQGTVKQLKEYFQKIQDCNTQKRNNDMFLKKDKRGTVSVTDKSNKSNKSNKSDDHEKKNFNTTLERAENEKKCYSTEDDINTTLHLCVHNKGMQNKTLLEPLHSLNSSSILIKQKNVTEDTEIIQETVNKIDNHKNKSSDEFEQMDIEEIELLYNLISEMKKSHDNGEDYISNLIEELHNSNKSYMIQKIHNMLKFFDNKMTSEQGKKPFDGHSSVLPQVGRSKTEGKRNPSDELINRNININTNMNAEPVDKTNEVDAVEIKKNKHIQLGNKIYLANTNSESLDKNKMNESYRTIPTKDTKIIETINKEQERKKNQLINTSSPVYMKIKKYNSVFQDAQSKRDFPRTLKTGVDTGAEYVDPTTEQNKGTLDDNLSDEAKREVKNEEKNETSNEESNETINETSYETINETSYETINEVNKEKNNSDNNVTTESPNDSAIKNEGNHASKFEWFYSTMNEMYKSDIAIGEEKDERNGDEKDDQNEYSFEDSENNDLFLWLENRDVEHVLNGEKKN